jgi:hypothetical protein
VVRARRRGRDPAGHVASRFTDTALSLLEKVARFKIFMVSTDDDVCGGRGSPVRTADGRGGHSVGPGRDLSTCVPGGSNSSVVG